MNIPCKKTKIVATIGPASSSIETLEQMMLAGMNIVRINFAHGDDDTHRQVVTNVRIASQKTGKRIAIFGDLPGPKIRIGKLAQEPIQLIRGQQLILQTTPIIGDQHRVYVEFPQLPHVVNPNDNIYLHDGYITLKVIQAQGKEVITRVVVGGELRSHKGLNLPDIDLNISAFTEEDRRLLALAAKLELDGVSQSFVEQAKDIETVREAARHLNYDPLIIAKIERSRALLHLDEILQAADALMVARGDLGVEVPVEQVAILQKKMIQKALLCAKPVITATQMLESMTSSRRPTRAEVTDVTNAILDGADAVMLSGETAIGDYPVETVQMMTSIAQQAEKYLEKMECSVLPDLQDQVHKLSQDDRFSLNIKLIAQTMDPRLIIVPSLTGATARRVARFRMKPWIIAGSHHEKTCQRLQFSWGVHPRVVDEQHNWDEPGVRQASARRWCEDFGVTEGLVILIEGAGTLRAHDTRRIDIVNLDQSQSHADNPVDDHDSEAANPLAE